jgi:hypothetical protein
MADDVPMPYAGSDCGCACDPHGNGWDFGTKEGDEVTLSEFLAGGFAVALVIAAVYSSVVDQIQLRVHTRHWQVLLFLLALLTIPSTH